MKQTETVTKKTHSETEHEVEEHILACLSAAPSNMKIIHTAARMAEAFGCQFTALFVETPDYTGSSEENKGRLEEHKKTAERLGAKIEVVFGDDVAYQIAEFARLSGVTKIILGRSTVSGKRFFRRIPLTEQLVEYLPEIDIHIIPDKNAEAVPYHKTFQKTTYKNVFQNVLKTVGILAGTTCLSILFSRLGFIESNIIMVYILGVLLTSIVTSHLVYSLTSSIASVFIFNYFFTIPRFSLTAYGTGYPVTFVVMFLTAFITGTFAIRYKEQAGHAAKIAYRTKILFDANQLLSKAKNHDEILNITASQIIKLLERNIVIYDMKNDELTGPEFFQKGINAIQEYDYENEKKVVDWVMENNHFAGATTKTLPEAKYLYFALRVNERIYGVIGIEAENAPPDAFEHGILLSILGESALALENEKNAREKESAAILAESEQLRANLLRTISHDLRTPLTTISGNAGNLMANGSNFSEEIKHRIYKDIYEDALWLNNLVENLLYATRIEEGRMILSTSTEVLSDIVEEAMKHIGYQKREHQISVVPDEELILVKADAKLVMQVIINLVDNAIKYTQSGSTIIIEAKRKDSVAEISVSDNGSGIPNDEKGRIFEKFYCGEKTIVDNRRSVGLGLYLCKAIIEAHGGTICVDDNYPEGTVFRFTLPIGEVILNE